MKILKPILLLCCLFVVFNSCNGNKINSGRGTGGGGTGGGKPIVDLVVQQAWNDAK